jgi:4-amino-4-deoxy-L-arabinose transferase-like glycosyltransferase
MAGVWRLLLAAAILFTARMGDLAMPPLEDAFYAREAVEMHRAGRAFTVTWDGEPTHQHPPLQLWLIGKAFALLGESDGAARLPTAMMGLGVLAATYRIGSLTVGREAALVGTALLLASPIFDVNARRVMMEVPLTFWVALTILAFLEGLARPRWRIVLALPLGAAILTKSVLGLMPLLAIAGAALHPSLRPTLLSGRLWLGLGVGVALGAAWPVHQGMTQGLEAVRIHFFGHVVRRASRKMALVPLLTAYPLILLKFYQPVVLPALLGLVALGRRWRQSLAAGSPGKDGTEPDPGRGGSVQPAAVVLVTWILLPVILYSFAALRTTRFIFPILPALALVGGWWVTAVAPRVGIVLARWAVPVGAVGAALVLWVAPTLLTRDATAPFKRNAALLRATVPEGERVPYLGRHYWLVASPLLYYAERRLDGSSDTADEALATARTRQARVVLCARARCPELRQAAPGLDTVVEAREWALVRLLPGG